MIPALAVLALGLSAGPARALPPEVERFAQQASHQLYALDFEAARETAERLRAVYPRHPAAPAILAAARWWQARYWYRKPTDRDTHEVLALVQEAIRLAEEMAGDPARECEARFFLGGALGVKAHWMLLNGHWVAAARGARESVLMLRPLLACTEFAAEARFGLGLYQYAASKLPWTLRWLSRFVVGRADRDEGLRQLEIAATESRWMRSDAQATLALVLTIYDREPERALEHARRLYEERPDAPLAHSLYAQALAYGRKWTETLSVTAHAIAKSREPGSTFAHEESSYRYWQGVAFLGLRRPDRAVEAFDASFHAKGRKPWRIAALFKRGGAKDLLGDRGGALADYETALGLPDPWKIKDRIRRHLDQPYTWNDFERELREANPN
jgi:tetratricopeptide (TPR) repeat protein